VVGSHLLRGPLRTSKELSCKNGAQGLIPWKGRQSEAETPFAENWGS